MTELKIAMLVRQFSPHGGLELYAHKVVEGLLAKGVHVTVVCQDKASELQHKNLRYKEIGKSPKTTSKRTRLAALYRMANNALADLDDVDLVHSQHCPTSEADVVTFHNHSTCRLSQVGLWWERALNESKRKFVPAYKLRDEHDEMLLRRAWCLIFPAQVMKDDFYSAYPFLNTPTPKPYVVAHPGASMAAPSAAQHPIAVPEGGKFNFLFVGRGFRKKGLDILFSACKILRERHKNFALLIAGLSAKPADKIRLALLGLDDCVKYLGFQKDMDAVYRQGQSIILPSRVEPFGMAPIQGMQRGLVPIVSRVSGVAEVLHNGEDALILEDHLNANELAALMEKLMTDSDLLKRLSANALLEADKITWEETVKSTLQAYEIAISLKKSGKTPLSK